jgi:hypothetical protein
MHTTNRRTAQARILELEAVIEDLATAAILVQQLFERIDEQRDRLLALVPATVDEIRQQRLADEWIVAIALHEHAVGTIQGSVEALKRVDEDLWATRRADRVAPTRRHAAAA